MASRSLNPSQIENNRVAVLWTFRHLLRATRIAFNGDDATLRAARTFARDSFRENSKLAANSKEAGVALEHAQGVTQILRENLVQGKYVEMDWRRHRWRRNRLLTEICRNVGQDRYKLNIHEHTQRLDNDTAGTLKGTKKSFKEIKDSIF